MEAFIFYGPPGSGKDTQSRLLEKRKGFKVFVMGDVLRASKDPAVLDVLRRGELIAPEVIYDVAFKHLKDSFKNGSLKPSDKVVFNGILRSRKQMELIEKLFKELGIKIKKVVIFNLDDNLIVDRLKSRYMCPKCGRIYNIKTKPPKRGLVCDADGTKLIQRDDDINPKAIQKRIKLYHKNQKDITEHFKDQNKVVFVDASGGVEDVYKNLINALGV